MERKPYPTDLTDAQWELIEPHIPPEEWGGRTRSVGMREVVNGILYLTRTGCQWRAIPNDLPNRSTVRHYYDRFRRDGTWHGLHDALRKHHDGGGIYTWWDLRAGAFQRDWGLRIDHFLVTPKALDACTGVTVDREARAGKTPSDHAPVVAEFE